MRGCDELMRLSKLYDALDTLINDNYHYSNKRLYWEDVENNGSIKIEQYKNKNENLKKEILFDCDTTQDLIDNCGLSYLQTAQEMYERVLNQKGWDYKYNEDTGEWEEYEYE